MRLRLSVELFIILAFTGFVFIWNLVRFETPGPSDAQATSAYSALIWSRLIPRGPVKYNYPHLTFTAAGATYSGFYGQ